jgi:hypothetical protein
MAPIAKKHRYKVRWSLHPAARTLSWLCRGASFLFVLICIRSLLEIFQLLRAGELGVSSLSNHRHLFPLVYGGLTPVIAYVVFFVNRGLHEKQGWTALWCCAIMTLPAVGYFTFSLLHTLPDGYPSVELVVNASIMLLLTALLWVGIILRRGMVRPLKEQEYYPLCATCGYNLMGNVSGVCPECGHAV